MVQKSVDFQEGEEMGALISSCRQPALSRVHRHAENANKYPPIRIIKEPGRVARVDESDVVEDEDIALID
jgi:hypothetical protein